MAVEGQTTERTLAPSDLPDWPRGLRAQLAAAYLGMSRSMFDAEVKAGNLPKPIRTVGSIDVWDRRDLDAWLDARHPAGQTSSINEWDRRPA